MASPVRLYVYDVTRGMASQLAPMLLGRALDGVWHTGIVAYGHEYFFGGGGIDYCLPSGTILGHPTETVNLGETEIPQDVFHDYLFELSNARFHGSAYHLLDHNCNTFSNEVAQFLTGQGIPERITNLPGEILSTPFGQMIRPFIDSMMVQVAAGPDSHHIGSRNPTGPIPVAVNPPAPAVPSTPPTASVNVSANSERVSSQNATANPTAAPPSTTQPPKNPDDIDLD